MKRIEHDGRETAYRVADRGAAGPTLVCVHGSGADRRVWKAQERLGGTTPVVSLDLSGHGASDDVDADPGAEALDAYAADVAAVTAAVDGDVLVGNSLGGAVVQQVVLEGLVPVSAAVLVGTGAKLAVAAQLRDLLAEDFDGAVSLLHEADRLFTDDADDRLVEASRDAMRACGRRVTERDFLTCHRFDVRDRLGAFDPPALATCGRRDTLTPPRYHTYLARHVPDGTFRPIDGAAHLAMLERPDRFNTALVAFLDHVASSSNSPASS